MPLTLSSVRAELIRRGMTYSEIEAEIARLRPSPPSLAKFVQSTVNFTLHDWQERYLCPALERCAHEKGIRLAIHKPPQYGGSIIVSQRFPAWMFGNDPVHRLGLACYNETRSAEFGEVVKQIMLSPQYGDWFPHVTVRKDAPASRFATAQREAMQDAQPSFAAMGLLSGFTGRGVDTLIMDDPYKSADEARSETINEKVWRFWSQTAKVRIDPTANVVVMFHRYHEDDFAGRLIDDGFEYLRFPAVADENADLGDPTGRNVGELLSPMRPVEFLEEIKESDLMTYLGMFQGVPRAMDGGIIKRDWLRTGEIPPLDLLVRYWDLATTTKQTGDWTVGALGGMAPGQVLCLKNIIRFRAEWPDVAAKIVETTEQEALEARRLGYRYVVAVDARISQQGFFQQLMRHRLFDPRGEGLKVPLLPDRLPGDKKERANGWVADARIGRFVMASDPVWNQAFINECLAFTGEDTDTDDQVDSVSGLYSTIWHLKGGIYAEKNEPKPGTNAQLNRLIRGSKHTGRGVFTQK